jgi:perosamine synthetase
MICYSVLFKSSALILMNIFGTELLLFLKIYWCQMKKLLFKSSPSKFGRGISLLWRGNSLGVLNSFFAKPFSFRKVERDVEDSGEFLFESARSAIYNSLMSQGVGVGDEVIISSFTCEAVTYAVARTGARVVYVDVNDDLTMCDDDVIAAIDPSTKSVVLQNTFGRLGLKVATIEALRSQGMFIIEDCALAVGSKVNNAHLGSFGDVSVWSMEVSKTVTIGWGGVVSANNADCAKALAERYKQLGAVSLIADFRRLFQLWFSVLMMKIRIPGAVFIWYFMYGTRLFRRSNSFDGQHPTKYEIMGGLSRSLFYRMQPLLADIFDTTNRNYRLLLKEADRLGLTNPVCEQDGEYVVSPRFSLLVGEQYIEDIVRQGEKIGVEVGRWFTDCPPQWGIEQAKIYSSTNSDRISHKIINFPCHWTLSQEDIGKIKLLMGYISSVK